MSRKRRNLIILLATGAVVALVVGVVFAIRAAQPSTLGYSKRGNNLGKFDSGYPALETAFINREEAIKGGGGWYETMNETFDDNAMPENWTQSPHGLRNYEYWCTNMVSFKDNQCVISSAKLDDNECTICPQSGYFTSGIETRAMVDGASVPTWEQAFGYFEVRVKVPRAAGMWTAFWLQSDFQGKIGNDGMDGTEIDVYESAFLDNPTMAGQALLYDGYAKYAKVEDYRMDIGYDLYEGYHTYGLKWSPEAYVWYVDGKPVYASNFGGVSQVPEFLRLTCEIRKGGTGGPHGYRLDEMIHTRENPALFFIDSIKVYQNTAFEPFIKSNDDYKAVR